MPRQRKGERGKLPLSLRIKVSFGQVCLEFTRYPGLSDFLNEYGTCHSTDEMSSKTL